MCIACIYMYYGKGRAPAGVVTMDVPFAFVGVTRNGNFDVVYDERPAN